MTRRRMLYLPVETKAREWLGKTLLAAKAAERGWTVVLGKTKDVYYQLELGAPGACIENSIPDMKVKRLTRAKHKGHRILNLCEEAILYPGTGAEYCAGKIGGRALPHVDRLLAPGSKNAKDLASFRPDSRDRICITGNPRFDTLLPGFRSVYEHEASTLRERFGCFLLVNTNFGRANPHERGRDMLSLVENEAQAALLRRQTDYKRRQMNGLKAMLSDIASAGAFDHIVLRPHPTENHDVWREWAEPLGIEVRFEGSANNWLMAADAILHPGCTTGIEGLLLDRPVASFVPDPGSEFLNPSDAASAHVSSAEEFMRFVEEWRPLAQIALRDRFVEQREGLRPFIDNVDPPVAVDRIMDTLDGLDVPDVPYAEPLRRKLRGIRWWRRCRKLRRQRNIGGRSLQKFPYLNEEDLTVPLERWIEVGVLAKMPSFTRLSERAYLLS